jgi:hypothetical protein
MQLVLSFDISIAASRLLDASVPSLAPAMFLDQVDLLHGRLSLGAAAGVTQAVTRP